jgi:VanZ family protein
MLNKRSIFILLFWGLITAITILLLLEVKPTPQTWPKDKLEHAIVFALLTYLGIRTYAKQGLYICLALIVYGGLMEQAQSLFTQTRTGSMGDWLADVVGIAFVIYTSNVYKKPVAVKHE